MSSNGERESTPSFFDNRPEALQMKMMQTAADNSPQVKKIAQLQKVANGRSAPIQQKPNNTGLPDNLKSGIENLSGYSMDDVKVHENSDKPAQLQAHAYAEGTDIHLGPGQEKHLPHEAWHVVQQKQGRVQPTRQLKGKVAINDDQGLEKEADLMGQKALSSNEDHGLQLKKSSEGRNPISQLVVQRIEYIEAVEGAEYLVRGVRRRLTRKNNGWLRFEGLETAVHASEVDELDSDSGYSSDEGETSEGIALDAIEKANTGRKGPAKQAERNRQLDRLKHFRGRIALERAAAVSVGPRSANQGTFGMGTTSEGEFMPVTTSASAPFSHFATSHGAGEPLNTRTEYGTGSHVHAEAGLIRQAVQDGRTLAHVSVNKDFCPVCAAVLRAFGVGFNETYVREEFPATWRNPFDRSTETDNWQRASQAARTICSGQITQLLNC